MGLLEDTHHVKVIFGAFSMLVSVQICGFLPLVLSLLRL